MSDDRVELEFKLRVPGEQAFRALTAVAGGPRELPEPVVQVNRFFDVPDLVLSRSDFVLRLREEGGVYRITAKGPELTGRREGAISRKAEEEIEVSAAEAASVRAGEVSPLALLEERVQGSRLIGAIRRLVGDADLAEVGAFENARRRVGPLELEAGLTVLFEMDRTSFPGDRTDFEVEVEVHGEEEEPAGRALRELFARAGLEWCPSPSKAERFFDALGMR